MIELKLYRFKEEFCEELKIPKNQSERRLDELLEWLKNFYDYEFIKGRPHCIKINEIIGEYQQMPRKLPKKDRKIEDYKDFTIAALGTEFKPNSKRKVARDAIHRFGRIRYYHTSPEAVARRYVGPVFDEYGESDGKKKWVNYSDYSLMTDEQMFNWHTILRKYKIAEDEAANAFYAQAQGENIDDKISAYKEALDEYKDTYGDVPVLVQSWRLK